jgi:phosphatidate cytidylyltransferase
VMGFVGGLTMSAIRRDGTAALPREGDAGVLDRIDSLCFAAPVFFHLTRFYFARDAGV